MHTLFAYEKSFRALWELYSGPFSKSESGAHLPNSAPMAELRVVVAGMAVDWNERCDALRLPFDRSHRDVDRRALPFRNDENLPAPSIDDNIISALGTSMQLILGMPARNVKAMSVARFTSVVVQGTLVYLHERDLRRQCKNETCSLLALQREYEAGAANDIIFSLLPEFGATVLGALCPEFAARQARPATRVRVDTQGDLSVRSGLASLHDELTHQDALGLLDVAEARVCTIIRCAPRDEPAAGVEYLWPHAFAVADKYEVKLTKINERWTRTPSRLIAADVPKTPEPPPYSPCPGFEDETKFASSSGSVVEQETTAPPKNALAPLTMQAATSAPDSDSCDASQLMDSLLTDDERVHFEAYARSPVLNRHSLVPKASCCADGQCSTFARGLLFAELDDFSTQACTWTSPLDNYILD